MKPIDRLGLGLAVVAIALWLGSGSVAGAQPPIRIGASYSQTGSLAAMGRNQLHGVQLCVKHASDRGGVLGRRLVLLVEDDLSKGETAAAIYEKLIAQDKVDAIIGPYSSPITEVMADVTERHRMPMVAAGAATTSIFRKGRKFIFGIHSPSEVYLEGLIDLAVSRGLKTVAVIYEDTLLQKTIAQGALELAKKRGLQIVVAESYPKGTTDFGGILRRVKIASPDVLAAATYEVVVITRLLKELGINPKMFGATVGVALPKFQEALGRDAEFVYGASQWEPELVTLRAGGLIPIARQYPGAREFVEAYRKEFPGAELSYHSAAGYGGCQVLIEAIRRAGALDGEKVRETILKLDFNTAFGAFKVEQDGFQIAHKMVLFQWQEGKKVIVWPEEIAAGKPRFPTPPWSQRQ
ncbi:MAG: amino acid ABC transporter substrate-binding protein [Candidatus Rokuibacteriota bacterium]